MFSSEFIGINSFLIDEDDDDDDGDDDDDDDDDEYDDKALVRSSLIRQLIVLFTSK